MSNNYEWQLTDDNWRRVVERAANTPGALEDGAFVQAEADLQSGDRVLVFYASRGNRPAGWHYSFVEQLDGVEEPVAYVGMAWRRPETNRVEFEVTLYAAERALTADFEGGVGAMDALEYEQAVERAVRGTPADEEWLRNEFGRLVWLT